MPDSNQTNMEVKHEELRALAEAATPGPWQYRPKKHDDWGWVRDDGDTMIVACRGFHSEAELNKHRTNKTDPWGADAQFIAAANPATVLALLAEIGRLKEALESIALLDEADGHELEPFHAMRAVAIATNTLGKHPSQIFSERRTALSLREAK